MTDPGPGQARRSMHAVFDAVEELVERPITRPLVRERGTILSVGKGLELIKDLGDAATVAEQYGLRGFVGTHAIDLWPKEIQALRNSVQVLRQTIDTVLGRLAGAK